MARKLYPPYIDGKVPAFSGTVLRIPFRHNRAVTAAEYQTIACKLKTVSTNEWVWTLKALDKNTDIIKDYKTGNWYVQIDIPEAYANKLLVGLYYKILIAYIDNSGAEGYYSDVGVTKYTSVPNIYIDGLNSGNNASKYNYVGVYNQYEKDVSEKEYSYNFTIYTLDNELFYTTGEQIHNSLTDVLPYESRDSFYCNKELIANQQYKLVYTVTTLNGMECYSPTYYIMKKDTVRPSINAKLIASNDFDNGSILLSLEALDDKYYSGNFLIQRSSSKDNFGSWNEIGEFKLEHLAASLFLFTDFTVEQGVSYTYSLQQYNSYGLYSNRITSNTVLADFEDMFLYDGKRQLKIKFNPAVSSFKNDILESKVDTIGGKYPFIFRNGIVDYKEFPVSGLISYFMDDQEYFIKKSELGSLEFETTDLVSDNVRAERIFKLEVMSWLTNGEPKLFRSATEGNYLVRLLNTSLSPNTVIGRMLHTFQATAYEIADFNFLNLISLGLFTIENIDTTIMRFETIDLEGKSPGDTLSASNAYLGEFFGVAPGSIFELDFSDGLPAVLIMIGDTLTYHINTGDKPVTKITLIHTPNLTGKFDGQFTYGYVGENSIDNFNTIINLTVEDILSQWMGKYSNIIPTVEDIKHTIGRFYFIKATVRSINNVYSLANRFYWDANRTIQVNKEEFLPTDIYVDLAIDDQLRYYDGQDLIEHKDSLSSVINNSQYYWLEDECDYTFAINDLDNNINLKTIKRYIINDLSYVSLLRTGNMIMIDAYYQLSEKTYSVELDDVDIFMAYQNYTVKKQELIENYFLKGNDSTKTPTQHSIDVQYNKVLNAYNNYIGDLEQKLSELEG